jgi:hypothetical protein
MIGNLRQSQASHISKKTYVPTSSTFESVYRASALCLRGAGGFIGEDFHESAASGTSGGDVDVDGLQQQ